jgi:GntR family transcriptional regulator, rspAB operon transcriptional repressor
MSPLILPVTGVPPADDRPKSLTDQIQERLREEILTATWRPGDLVLEAELSARYGVSKTPVREALRLLSKEGWIITLPRKGYLVRPLRLQDVKEIFELRLLLEPGLFVQAMRTSNGRAHEQLRRMVEAQHLTGVDDSAASAGRGFHLAAVGLTRNERALATVSNLLNEVRRLHHLMPGIETHGSAEDMLTDHEAIVDAMTAGDSQRLFTLTRDHIQASAARLMNAFRLTVD